MAKKSGRTLIEVNRATILSRWAGESEKIIGTIAKLAEDLRPSLVFIGKCLSWHVLSAAINHRSREIQT